MNSVFNVEEINEQIKKLKLTAPKHYLTVYYADPNHDEVNALCLTRVQGRGSEVLLSKVRKDREEFDEMAENLSVYFDAEIIKHP